MSVKKIGITLGDPMGIGPEIALKAACKYKEVNAAIILIGPAGFLHDQFKKSDINSNDFLFKTWDPNIAPVPGLYFCHTETELISEVADKKERARITLEMLDLGIELARSQKIDALVTAPIDKSVIRELIPDFDGHTEYLAKRCEVPRTVMLLDNAEMRIVPLTQHIPLRDVTKDLTSANIVEIVKTLHSSLHHHFEISHPRFVLAGINPHAGEIVNEPEEISILKPAIAELKKIWISVDGPFAADSLFPRAKNNRDWDVVLSPYHDQALVAAKYPGLEKVVNITMGLPFLRVSPGHGVAYDLAGKNQADTKSMERAISIAIEGNLGRSHGK